jgi:hypothetical protein
VYGYGTVPASAQLVRAAERAVQGRLRPDHEMPRTIRKALGLAEEHRVIK